VNNLEQQVRDLLEQIAPEPAWQITVDDLAARLTRPAPREAAGGPGTEQARRWVPLGAAAAVAVVIGGVVAAAQLLPGPTRPAVPKPGMIAGVPWDARPIGDHPVHGEIVAQAGSSLYVLRQRDDGYFSLTRINPATGQTLASTTVGRPYLMTFAIAQNTLWTITVGGGSGKSAQLLSYNLATLAPAGSPWVPGDSGFPGAPYAGGNGPPVLAGDGSGLLYAGQNGTVKVIDAAQHKVLQQIHVPGGFVTSLAVNPTGTRLYAATSAAIGSVSQLSEYRLPSGTPAGSVKSPASHDGNASDLVATATGVWGVVGPGSVSIDAPASDWQFFALAANLAASRPVGPAPTVPTGPAGCLPV
jgi:hypothetical protein